LKYREDAQRVHEHAAATILRKAVERSGLGI
jgi:hypothetical protein